MMIWHIFKKDWTLLWRFAVGVGTLYVIETLAQLRIGRFRGAPLAGLGAAGRADLALFTLTNVFPTACMLASAFLIVAIVQQDAIPGVRQDWLVRPIRRLDLLVAKMLGVLLMVLGPIFVADFSGVLLNGFPIGQALTAAFGNAVWLWFAPFLAVFVLAALTQNFMEAVVGGTAVVALGFAMGPLWRLPVPCSRFAPASPGLTN